MTSFEGTIVVVGDQPTTYGEIRKHAQGVSDRSLTEMLGIMASNPVLVANASKGMATVLVWLLDEVERLTQEVQGATP